MMRFFDKTFPKFQTLEKFSPVKNHQLNDSALTFKHLLLKTFYFKPFCHSHAVLILSSSGVSGFQPSSVDALVLSA